MFSLFLSEPGLFSWKKGCKASLITFMIAISEVKSVRCLRPGVVKCAGVIIREREGSVREIEARHTQTLKHKLTNTNTPTHTHIYTHAHARTYALTNTVSFIS